MRSQLTIFFLLIVSENACQCRLGGYRDSRVSEVKINNALRVIAALKRDRLDVVVHPRGDDAGVMEGVLTALWMDDRCSLKLYDAPAHCYVFVVFPEEIEEALSGYAHLRARSKVVVIEPGPEATNLSALFATMRRRGIYDVVVVGERVLTWRPFSDSVFCGRPDATNVVPWRESDANFPVSDFRGCEVTVTTLVWPPYVSVNYSDGLEMIRILAAAANFSVSFRSPSSSVWYASYKDVSSGLTDVAMGSLMGISRLFLNCDTTIFYLTEAIKWAIPSPARLPRWRSLSLAFEKEVWAATAVILVCTVATLRVLGERDVSRAALLTAWPAMLATSGQSPTPAVGRRIFFAVWVMYCLLLDTAFTSVLVGILVDPGREPRLTDEQQVIASQLEIGYSEGMDSVIGEHIRGRGTYCNDYGACLDRVAFRGDFAFVVPSRFVSYISKKRYETTKEPLFYTLDENIMTSGITTYFRKGHPAVPRVNAILWRVLSAGLFSAWEADLSRQVALSANETVRNSPNVILTLDHFQSAFLLLALGCFLSALTFTSEILVYKRHLRRMNAPVKISY